MIERGFGAGYFVLWALTPVVQAIIAYLTPPAPPPGGAGPHGSPPSLTFSVPPSPDGAQPGIQDKVSPGVPPQGAGVSDLLASLPEPPQLPPGVDPAQLYEILASPQSQGCVLRPRRLHGCSIGHRFRSMFPGLPACAIGEVALRDIFGKIQLCIRQVCSTYHGVVWLDIWAVTLHMWLQAVTCRIYSEDYGFFGIGVWQQPHLEYTAASVLSSAPC